MNQEDKYKRALQKMKRETDGGRPIGLLDKRGTGSKAGDTEIRFGGR